MKVIPVIDILDGIVVHAIRGKRKEYQPLKSVLCASTEPLAVATAFKLCGFSKLYVADLDDIMSKGNNLRVLKEITEKTGLELMVDSGITDLDRAQKALQSDVSRVIIGTETLSNLNFVKEAIARFGSEKVVVSLDLINGQVLSKCERAKLMGPLMLAGELQKMGVAQMVVLDLARVGSGEGVDLQFLKDIHSNIGVKVLVGGGVRDICDLVTLKNIGVSGVLLATALHSGCISVDALQRENFL